MTADRRRPEDSPDEIAHDPLSELGLRDPVRDKDRLGDAQYNPSPPRSEVHAPRKDEGVPQRVCAECGTALGPGEPQRSDAEEYAYHFCGAGCRDRWHDRSDASSAHDDPRRPVP